MSTPTLVVIAGATATGKTETAIRVAEHFSAPVISCDSRQFYKEIPIGTAAPTAEQSARVPHYFVGNKSIPESYNCGQYEQEVLALLEELFRTHEIVVMTGGSGLYIEAVCHGFDDIPSVDPAIREILNRRLSEEGLEALTGELKLLDPEYYASVDRHNPNRVIRALEVCLSTGQAYSAFRKGIVNRRPFRIVKIALDIDRELLYERIDLRVDRMIAEGLVEEARRVFPYREHNALQTVGYRELFSHFDGDITLEKAVELIKRNSRRYAKRQFTWFRRDPDMRWFGYDRAEEIIRFIGELAGTEDGI